jgi:hypothetical protein
VSIGELKVVSLVQDSSGSFSPSSLKRFLFVAIGLAASGFLLSAIVLEAQREAEASRGAAPEREADDAGGFREAA